MNSPEQRVLTREQVRAVDRHAIEVLGIPGVVLMENAGRGAAEIILAAIADRPGAAVHCIAGRGNNGGDAFVIARHVHLAGVAVRIWLAADADKLAGDAATNHAICKHLGLPILPLLSAADIAAAQSAWAAGGVLVDGLLGTGFAGDVREPIRSVIAAINAAGARQVFALDVPSGLDCDTGRPGGIAVEADHTITFVARKPGFSAAGAGRYTGQVHVVGIGAPPPPPA